MHRLLVATELLRQQCVDRLPVEAARHLKALRPKPGEEIELFDGAGSARVYRRAGEAFVAAGEVRRAPRPNADLTLFACVTKGSRWDWTIEKSVELGATRIVPVISERTIVRLAPNERAAKADRWRKIAEDAARQSDAAWLPEILPAMDFAQSLELAKTCGRVFAGALVSPPAKPLLRAALDAVGAPAAGLALDAVGAPAAGPALDAASGRLSFALFVGPEGDFTPSELAELLKVAQATSFGPSILRAETAAVYGLSVLASVMLQASPKF